MLSERFRGSCRCGEVRFELTGPPERASRCFCSLCRKQIGSAFGANPYVRGDRFRFVAGASSVRGYVSSPGVTRTFCSRCGASLHWKRDGKEGFGLALGSLDDDPRVEPTLDLHPEDAAFWYPVRH